MPVDELRDPVEVLVELPRQARLADPGDAGHRDELRPLLLCAGVKQILDLTQLPIPADERGLQALRLERPADAGDHAHRLPERGQALLALQLERARVLVDDRLLGRPPSGVADVDTAGFRDRLHPRGGVDQIAGDHPLGRGADRHRCLAGQHPRASTKALGVSPPAPAPTPPRRARAPPAPPAPRRPPSPPACPRRPSPHPR